MSKKRKTLHLKNRERRQRERARQPQRRQAKGHAGRRGDPRIVHGATCAWWDSIDKVGSTASGLPACPHCGGVLFECPNEQSWWEGAEKWEQDGHPGYVAFLEWLRGKCFANLTVAREVYELERVRIENPRLTIVREEP